jgi:hypothetical protein
VPSPIAALKSEWRCFRDDPPGERFERHHDRMQERSRALLIIQVLLGVLLMAAGVVLLFIPGPGLLVMAFGLGLLAGTSRRIAKWMDRAEPRVRERWQALKAWWRRKRRRGDQGTTSAISAGPDGEDQE